MRRFVKTVLVLAVVLVVLAVLDQVARVVAERQVATRIQTAQQLSSKPSVSLAGWPFTSQAIRGRYTGGTLVARDVTKGKLRIDRLSIKLDDVHEPLGRLVHRDLSTANAQTVTATAHLTFADLATASGVDGLQLSGNNGRLGVSRTVTVFGQSADLSATARLVVLGGKLSAEDIIAKAGPVTIPQTLAEGAVTEALTELEPGALPYGLRLATVRVTSTGLDLTAQAQDVDLIQSTGTTG